MITREEVKSCMYLIANEYDQFMPANKQMAQMKVDTWHEILKDYNYTDIKEATIYVLKNHTYGAPKISHIVEAISNVERNNILLEFNERMEQSKIESYNKPVKQLMLGEWLGYHPKDNMPFHQGDLDRLLERFKPNENLKIEGE